MFDTEGYDVVVECCAWISKVCLNSLNQMSDSYRCSVWHSESYDIIIDWCACMNKWLKQLKPNVRLTKCLWSAILFTVFKTSKAPWPLMDVWYFPRTVADHSAGDCRGPEETSGEETWRNGPPITWRGKTAGGSQEGEQPVPGQPATVFSCFF